jgi:hypothetical protein
MSKLSKGLQELIEALEKGGFAAARPRLSGEVLKVEELEMTFQPLDPMTSEPIDLWCGNVPKFYDGVLRKVLIPKSDMDIWKAISK